MNSSEALFSASATYLFNISSYWSRIFISSDIYLSTSYCLTAYFYLNLSSSFVFFKKSRAYFFLPYSSIFISSSFSFTAINYCIYNKSSLAFLNPSRVSAAFFFLSRSLNFSLSSSSSTYFLISLPSNYSSLIFLI